MILTLVILAILGVSAAIMSRTAQTELFIVGAWKMYTKAFYEADSGVSIVYAKGFEDYHSDTIDAEVFIQVDEYGNEIIRNGAPVIIVESHGYWPNKDHPRRGISEVEGIFANKFLDWLKAPLQVKGDLVSHGVACNAEGDWGFLSGQDCDIAPDVCTGTDATEGNEASDWTGDYGMEFDYIDRLSFAFFQPEYDKLKSEPTVPLTGKKLTNLALGDECDNPFQVFRHEGSVTIQNLSGYGVLLVDGDLTLGGNIDWHGLILVQGSATFNGGGVQKMYGAVAINGETSTVNGNPEFLWDCNIIRQIQNNHIVYRMVAWREVR